MYNSPWKGNIKEVRRKPPNSKQELDKITLHIYTDKMKRKENLEFLTETKNFL